LFRLMAGNIRISRRERTGAPHPSAAIAAIVTAKAESVALGSGTPGGTPRERFSNIRDGIHGDIFPILIHPMLSSISPIV